jgi:two-component system chemotaxis response regulator CheY
LICKEERVSKPVNVLIVDDSAMMRAIIRRAVQLSGVEGLVHEAANGREALAVLEATPIDAMFTDINMPVMSGPELLRAMAGRDWDHIHRIIVSTDGSDARRAEVRDLNVAQYLEKPFAPEMIRDVLMGVSGDVAAR